MALFEIPDAGRLRLQLERHLAGRFRVVDPAQEVVQRGGERIGDCDRVAKRDSTLVVLDGRDLAAGCPCYLREVGLGEPLLLPPRADAVSGDAVGVRLTFLKHGKYLPIARGREKVGLTPRSSGPRAVGKSGRSPFLGDSPPSEVDTTAGKDQISRSWQEISVAVVCSFFCTGEVVSGGAILS